MTTCEYADGAKRRASHRIPRVPTLAAANERDADAAQHGGRQLARLWRSSAGSAAGRVVTEIWVPAASAIDTAYYDVAATFTFAARP